jgi:DNA (cytosine-5)-methyltransferase 1
MDDEVGQVTIQGYLAVLKALKPKAFLLENVAGMAYKVHREALDFIVQTATDAGYNCTWRVINAANYGVPQIRERFFLVGLQQGEFRFPAPSHEEGISGDLISGNERLPRWRTAGEAISDLDTEENSDDKGHFAGGKYHDLLVQIPPGENYLFFTKERGHPNPVFKWRSRYWSYLLKLSPDLPSWTIQARRSNNIGPFHWRNRILRIAEVKRLQTFPDSWQLAGRLEQQWRQVGNAVPPRLAYHLGRSLIEYLQLRSGKGAGRLPSATERTPPGNPERTSA